MKTSAMGASTTGTAVIGASAMRASAIGTSAERTSAVKISATGTSAPIRHPEGGFTLIETLVALVVLAVTSVALLTATEAHITRIGGLETRAAAAWVTENHLAELSLGLIPVTPPAMLGIAFDVTETRTPTRDPALTQVTLTATEPGTTTAFGRLTGFLDTGDTVAGLANSGATDRSPTDTADIP